MWHLTSLREMASVVQIQKITLHIEEKKLGTTGFIANFTGISLAFFFLFLLGTIQMWRKEIKANVLQSYFIISSLFTLHL